MRISAFTIIAAAALAGTGCTHTPAGTSVEVALAKKPEVVRFPAPPVIALAKTQPSRPAGSGASGAAAVQPEKTELVADAFSRGEFCMGAGKDAEAIAAFEEVTKIDPSFADAWQRLAALYEKTGQEKKAMDAFRKSKMVADARPMH